MKQSLRDLAKDAKKRDGARIRIAHDMMNDVIVGALERLAGTGDNPPSDLDRSILAGMDVADVQRFTWKGPERDQLLALRAELRATLDPLPPVDVVVRPPLQTPPPTASTPDWLLEAQAAAE